MADNNQPSSTEGQAQDGQQDQLPTGSVQPDPSKAAAPQGEQQSGVGQPPATPAPPEISEAERIRRAAQSIADKRIAEIQKQQAAAAERQRQEAEQRRLAEMDDDELGQYVREQQRSQAIARQAQTAALATAYQQMQDQLLELVPQADDRAALESRVSAGEFKSYAEFAEAALQLKVASEVEKAKKHLEAEIRQALTNEGLANDAETGGPVTSAGAPTASFRNLSTHDKIAAGIADRRKKKTK